MRRSAAASPGVSLFPFLAVLLCTMGALVVVLVVINRQVRTKAAAAAAQDAAHDDDLAMAEEQLALQVSQLSAAREKTLADLEEARRRLSGIEDHSRQIVKQIEALQAAAKQLPDATAAANPERDALRAELARLNEERMKLEGELSKAKTKARYRKPAFAVVPFDGMHKTYRRPIYLECRADSVILQPEGIVFTPADFMGPGGPGNPLASALRAAQEYWNQQPPPAADIPNEPYPLLLVRPDGIIGYYLARDAMASWDAEFGYELVDADWKLDYPLPPQVTLKAMEERAVVEARQRLEWLAQISPERFERKAKAQYRLARAGGLVREGASQLGGVDPFANDPLGGFGRSQSSGGPGGSVEYGGEARGLAGSFGGASADPGSGNGNVYSTRGNSAIGGYGAGGNDGLGGGDRSMASGSGQFAGNGSGSDSGLNSRVSGFGTGYGEYGNGNIGGAFGSGGAGFDRGAGGSQGGNGQFSQSSGQNDGLYGQQQAGAAGSFGRDGSSGQAGQSFAGQNSADAGGSGASDRGGAEKSGNTSASPGQQSFAGTSGGNGGGASEYGGAPGGNASGSASGNAAGSPGGSTSASSMGQAGGGDPSAMAAGMPSPNFELNNNQAMQPTASQCVADIRGKNWAISKDSNASVPITRPVRLECWSDRIIVISDARDQQSQVIPLTSRTEESIDQIVGAVREHTRRWGMAGRGMYWKPQLTLDVNPNGEGRAKDLQVLLANSGMDVKRK